MATIDTTKTAPWSPDTHALLTKTLSHTVAARIVTSNELRRNLVVNPNLETVVTGWAGTTGTFSRDTVAPIDGTASAKVVAAGGTAIGMEYLPTSAPETRPPVEAGAVVEVSCRLKCSVSTAVRCDVSYYDEAGAVVGSIVTTGPAPTPAANTPTTITYTVVPPAGATRIRLLPRTVGNQVAGVALWADSGYVGTSGTTGGYFDGNTTDTATRHYGWEGTPNLSQSVETDPTAPSLTVPLSVKSGTVTFDETRSPRAEARGIVCAVPDNQATLDAIDPRTGARLQLDVGYSRPDGLTDVNPFVDLVLRDRPVARPDDTMTVSGLGDESLVIDNAPSNGGTLTGTTTVAAIQSLIRTILPATVLANPSALAGAAVSQSPMGDKHDLLMDLSDRIEAKTFDDGLRNWSVVPVPTLATPALALEVGANGTIVESDTTLSRDDGWYNRVFLTYDWTDASDVQHIVTAVRSITSGPYAAKVGNVRTLELTRKIPATQTEANAAATALVKRTVTRGRSFTVRAISAYWLRPGMTVSIDLPLGGAEEHLVSSVAFDLAAGTMSVTTRLPDGTYTVGA
jgi:hypothetical protein